MGLVLLVVPTSIFVYAFWTQPVLMLALTTGIVLVAVLVTWALVELG